MSETPSEIEGIVYVGEDGAPEEEVVPESRDAHLEEKVESLPALTTAAELLADDPLSSLPVEEPDDETPPDPTPLTDKRYGPRGTPKRDEWDALQRSLARNAEAEIAADPMVQQAVAQEAVRTEQKRLVTEAFLKAQAKKS